MDEKSPSVVAGLVDAAVNVFQKPAQKSIDPAYQADLVKPELRSVHAKIARVANDFQALLKCSPIYLGLFFGSADYIASRSIFLAGMIIVLGCGSLILFYLGHRRLFKLCLTESFERERQNHDVQCESPKCVAQTPSKQHMLVSVLMSDQTIHVYRVSRKMLVDHFGSDVADEVNLHGKTPVLDKRKLWQDWKIERIDRSTLGFISSLNGSPNVTVEGAGIVDGDLLAVNVERPIGTSLQNN